MYGGRLQSLLKLRSSIIRAASKLLTKIQINASVLWEALSHVIRLKSLILWLAYTFLVKNGLHFGPRELS